MTATATEQEIFRMDPAALAALEILPPEESEPAAMAEARKFLALAIQDTADCQWVWTRADVRVRLEHVFSEMDLSDEERAALLQIILPRLYVPGVHPDDH